MRATCQRAEALLPALRALLLLPSPDGLLKGGPHAEAGSRAAGAGALSLGWSALEVRVRGGRR